MKLSDLRELCIPIFMFCIILLICCVSIYLYFGPHTIYQDTVIIKQIFWEDGSPCFFSQQGNVYYFDKTDNLTWKKMLDIKNNDTLHITVSQDVMGGKAIISIRDE